MKAVDFYINFVHVCASEFCHCLRFWMMLLVFPGTSHRLYKYECFNLSLSKLHDAACVLLYECVLPQVSCLALLSIFLLIIKRILLGNIHLLLFYWVFFVCLCQRRLLNVTRRLAGAVRKSCCFPAMINYMISILILNHL